MDHHLSVERDQACQSFIQANSNPKHMVGELSELLKPLAKCKVCGDEPCDAHRVSTDLMVAGFPCTPYSIQSSIRFKPDYDPMTHPEFSALPLICKYIRYVEPGPEVIVLENVEGVLKSIKGKPAPIHFIENGVLEVDGEIITMGIRHLTDKYEVLPHFKVKGHTFGLPFSRCRVLWVLLRREGNPNVQQQKANIIHNMGLIASNPLEVYRLEILLENFDACDDGAWDPPMNEGKRRRTQHGTLPMTVRSILRSDEWRKAKGLPKVCDEGGRPYSTTPQGKVLRDTYKLTDLELDTLDCAFLFLGMHVFQQAAIDVSQSPCRTPWSTQRMPSVTRNTKIFFQEQILTPRDMLCLMGWKPGSFSIPQDVGSAQIKCMLGNMLCPPVIGAMFLAIMARDVPAAG